MSNETFEKIEENWKSFTKLAEKISGSRGEHLREMLTALKDRIEACPASTRTEYHGAYPGGLVEHSLRVFELASELNRTYETNISTESLIICSLIHDLGKIGNGNLDYYVEKESEWHNKQGIMYETNTKLSGTVPSLRSLWWINQFGIELTETEFLAIASIKDRLNRDDESIPVNGESMLSVILQQSVKVACMRGKGKNSVIK